MKKEWLDDLLLKLLLADSSLILLMEMLSMDFFVSVFFYLLFPLSLIYWLMHFPKKPDEVDVLIFGVILLSCVIVGFDFVALGKPLKFEYFKKLIFFVIALLFLQLCHHKKLKPSQIRMVYKWSEVQSLMFVAMYLLQSTDRYLINGKVSRYLTMDFSNPNLLALFLAVFIMIEASGFFMKQTKKQNKARLFRTGALLYLLLETQARNSQLVVALFGVVFAFVYFSEKKEFTVSKWLTLCISYFPIFFSAVYMLVVESPWIQSAFGFLSGVGKKLNSRVEMWSEAWEIFLNSIWKGSYFTISHSYGFSQMHNTLLDTAASYGIFVMILLGLVFWGLMGKKRLFTDKRRLVCFAGFCGVVILGMGETALLVGSLGIFVSMGMPLMLANGELVETDLECQGASFSETKKRIQNSKEIQSCISKLNKLYSVTRKRKVSS